MIEDPKLHELAQVCLATRDAHREYEQAHRTLAETLHGAEHAVLGQVELRGRWRRKTSYAIPDDVRQRYRSVDRLGTWTMRLERLGDE